MAAMSAFAEVEQPADLASLIERIADETARKMIRYQSPVVDEQTAMDMTGKRTSLALARWRRTYDVPACGEKRYSREAIMRGLQREAKQRLAKSAKRKAAAR